MRTLLVLVLALAATAQQSVRPKDVREAAKAGSSAIPKLQEFLKDPNVDVRVEAVKQITEIGPPRSLDPLLLATQDNDPEVQILATDGLVNFYLPGYVKTGVGASLRRVGTSIKGHFTDTNDQVIDAFITVRPDVIAALGKLVRGGDGMDARANAARAAGILRAKAAVPDLIDATHSKDSTLIYEALVALEKIRDESAGPQIAFLLHDFDPKVQIAAMEAVGLLRDRQDLPQLVGVLNQTRNIKVKREALEAIAMLPAESSLSIYQRYLHDKDDKLRAAAAEGFARLKNPRDLPMLEEAWKEEQKTSPQLSLAFAQVMLGKVELGELTPLRFLINNLNSASYNGIAYPFLVELARDPKVRAALYGPLQTGTKEEKIGLARVLGRSGDAQSLPELQKLTNDPDSNVAQAALAAVRNLQAGM
jgi:HEAT repeat protein